MKTKRKVKPKKARLPLPILPSDLIMLALKDLMAVEKLKSYKINMGKWHEPNGKCSVCLAGAVMVKELKIPKYKSVTGPGGLGLSDREANCLSALDRFRRGDIEVGLNQMGLLLPPGTWGHQHICRYEDNKGVFYRDMERLARNLRMHNY